MVFGGFTTTHNALRALVGRGPRWQTRFLGWPLMCRFLDAGGVKPVRALGRPASKKRQGAKSRQAGPAAGSWRYGDFRLAAYSMQARHRGRRDPNTCTRRWGRERRSVPSGVWRVSTGAGRMDCPEWGHERICSKSYAKGKTLTSQIAADTSKMPTQKRTSPATRRRLGKSLRNQCSRNPVLRGFLAVPSLGDAQQLSLQGGLGEMV